MFIVSFAARTEPAVLQFKHESFKHAVDVDLAVTRKREIKIRVVRVRYVFFMWD